MGLGKTFEAQTDNFVAQGGCLRPLEGHPKSWGGQSGPPGYQLGVQIGHMGAQAGHLKAQAGHLRAQGGH